MNGTQIINETVKKEELINRAIQMFEDKGKLDIIYLAKGLGLDVYAVPNIDNACIEMEELTGEISIKINENHPYNRQRFSIAHEIAHYVLHPEELKNNLRIDRSQRKTDLEREADQLASELLLPEKVLKDYLKTELEIKDKGAVNNSAISKIIKKFEVSALTAIIRLRALGYYVPFIVID